MLHIEEGSSTCFMSELEESSSSNLQVPHSGTESMNETITHFHEFKIRAHPDFCVQDKPEPSVTAELSQVSFVNGAAYHV